VDLLALDDIGCFWKAILDTGTEVVVHAGKEELSACLLQAKRMPERVFDVQLAAGLIGMGYPLAYGGLVRQALGIRLHSNETRTDWRRRPLSGKQIEYALDDVRHILQVRDVLASQLEERGRLGWFEGETERMLQRIETQSTEVRWRRISGAGRLSRRELAVLRELAHWRDACARKVNRPVKHVLRDDLLIEMARRQPASPDELRRLRGVGSLRRNWEKSVIEAVAKGLALPEDETPERVQRSSSGDQSMVQKLLFAAMVHIAKDQGVTTELLGTNEDLRQLVAWHLNGRDPDEAPLLATGWRAELCGTRLADLLDGRLLMGIRANGPGLELDFVPADDC
jgi:ribonuclease D